MTIKEMLLPPLKFGTGRYFFLEELLVGIVDAPVDDRREVQVKVYARTSGWISGDCLQQGGRSSEETTHSEVD
jgi:hypothetical protein